MQEVLKILLISILSFVILFIFARFMGKKQIAELTFVDYVVGISMGSIAASMSTDYEKPFYEYIIALVVFFVLSILLSYLDRTTPFLKRLLVGKPTVVIYEGKLDYQNMKKVHLDVNNVLAMLREQGYFDITQIQYAMFETSGKISVLPIGAERPAVAKDLPIEITEPSLANYLVVDGVVSNSGLNEINKDMNWLFSNLGITCKKNLKKIALAVYDEANSQISVYETEKDSDVHVIKV